MAILNMILTAFAAIFGVIIMGAFMVMVLGGLFTAAGTVLGLLASLLDVVVWGLIIYWIWKSIFKK